MFFLLSRAEVFVPEDVEESDLANTDKSGEPQEDPFSSNLSQNDEDSNNKIGLTENPVGEKENNLSSEPEKKDESNLTKDAEENLQIATSQVLEHKNNGSKLVTGSKSSEPYWTEVMVNGKKQNVLVDVKTVTIIESISSAKPVSTKVSSSTNKSASKSVSSTNSKSKSPSSTSSPYIKVQMPSQYTSSSSVKKSSAKGSSTSTAKSTQHSSSKSKSSSTPSASAKGDGFAKASTSSQKSSTQKKSSSVSSSTTVGSIFDILKNLPAGGKESEPLFIEGNIKFPKQKEISRNVYKLSGYISG